MHKVQVALQVGGVKIYAARVETLGKMERQGETQFTTKTKVPPPLNANGFFFGVGFFFLNLTLFMIKLRVLALFSLFYRYFIIYL
jgi:hypothetical protein